MIQTLMIWSWMIKMEREEKNVRKALDFLLEHAEVKDLNLITIAIQDYENEGYDLSKCRKKVKELRRKYST